MARIRDEIGTIDGVRAADTGLAIERRFTRAGVHPFDELEWEIRDALIGDPAKPAFEQRDVEFPKSWSQNATNIVAQKYFRGQMGSPERERSVKQMVGRVAGTIAGWGREGGYFATHGRRRRVRGRAQPHPGQPACRLQLAGLVQRRLRGAAAVQRVLHPLRRGLDGVHPLLEHQGGHDLPRRLGLGDQPLEDPLLQGAAVQGRPRLRPRVVHARRRRMGRHDQVRRQDAARGQDGRARRRPPGHPALHLVQGARRGQGRGAGRGRLRHVDRRRGLPLHPVPEREQLGARDGGVPRRRRPRRRVEDDRARQRRDDRHAQRARPDERDRRGRLALRRPGHPVRHDDQRLAHVPEHGADQRFQPVQ